MAKKIISMLLAAAMMLTMLAACNTDEPIVDPDDGQQQEEQQGDGQGDEGIVSDVLNLVVDGVSDYVIVRGENAYISEVTASTELQSYLKQISGVEITIVTDATAPVEKEIVVGKTNREADGEFDREELGDDGLVIKTNGQKLFLVGGEQRGTLYAVYEFLESYLGCRFYTVDVEKVPEMKTISLDKIEEDKQIPVMAIYRDTGWQDYADANLRVKRKINGEARGTIPDELGGGFCWSGGHSFGWLVSREEYFDEHPEYYAVDEYGNPYEEDSWQLCLSNPEVIDVLVEKVKNWIETSPNVEAYHVSQNDNSNACMCENCKKIYEEENGALSGTLIRAINKIAESIKEEYPDKYIMTYAYSYTRSTPKTKPADNVIIQLCAAESCVSHPIDAPCSESSTVTYLDGHYNTFSEDFAAWGEVCDKILIYDYNMTYHNYPLTYPDFYVLRYNAEFFAKNGACAAWTQGNLQSRSCEFGELRNYLISKLYWNPYMSEEEYWGHMQDFLEGVYGPGWIYVKEYLDLAETQTESLHFGMGSYPEDIFPNTREFLKDSAEMPEGLTLDMVEDYKNTDWTPYLTYYSKIVPNEIIPKGYELFDKAIELAETESQKYELEKVRLQVVYLDSYYKHESKGLYMTNITLAVKNVLTQTDLSSKELNDKRMEIVNYIMDFENKKFYDFNKAFAEEMVAHGITYYAENHSHGYLGDLSNLDFSKKIENWQ